MVTAANGIRKSPTSIYEECGKLEFAALFCFMYTEKYCPKCEQTKPASAFRKNKGSASGLDSYCKECKKEYHRQYRKHSPAYKAFIKKKSKRIGWNRKKKVLDHYCSDGWKCAKCGFSDWRALSIDHINSDGAQHRKEIPGYKLYQWLIENNFPDGFQVLCMNCQFIKRHECHEFGS